MTNIFTKYFIMSNMLTFSISSIFINDFMNIWFLMEMNNFMFISLMSLYMKNKKMIFFYFLIQIISSIMLIFSISLTFLNLIFYNKMLILFTYLSLMIKLGLPPFHFWMPLLSPYMNWPILFFNLTIQKIIPFYLFSIIYIENYMIMLILILCSLIPPFMMLNLTNLKTLLTYSSINQSSWLMILIYLKNILWISYFIMYSFIYMCLFFILSIYKHYFNYMNSNNNYKMIILILMLNMSGLPPFSFFMFKWFSIFMIVNNSMNLFFMMILMIFSSFFMFFLYINMSYMSMFMYLMKSKMLNFNYNYFNFLKILSILFSIILMLPLLLAA